MHGSSWPSPPLRRGLTDPDAALDPQVGQSEGHGPTEGGLWDLQFGDQWGVHNTCNLVMPSLSERRSMIQIDIEVPDRPGEVAELAGVPRAAGTNIEASSGEAALGPVRVRTTG